MENRIESGWIALAGEYRAFPALSGKVVADWLIIGGGFCGLSAARELAARHPGDRIILIDAKKLAQGATGRNSGFNCGFDMPGFSRAEAPQHMADYLARTRIDIAGAEENARLIRALKIDCDFRATGYYYAVHDTAHFAGADEQARILQDAGAEAHVLEGEKSGQRFGSTFYRRALFIGGGGNGTLQPAKFSKALVETMPAPVELHEDTPASDLQPLTGGGAVVTIPGGEIRARRVMIGLNGLLPRFGFKRMQIVPLALTASLTRPLTEEEYAGIGSPEPWAVLSPIKGGTTARLTADRRILIRNTLEYGSPGLAAADVALRRRMHLRSLQRRFPWLGEGDIAFSWAGTMAGSRGHRFIFEQPSPGVFLTAGCNGNGVSRMSMLGRLLAQYATGDQNDLLSTTLALAKPGYVPPDPLLRIGLSVRFAWDEHRAASER